MFLPLRALALVAAFASLVAGSAIPGEGTQANQANIDEGDYLIESAYYLGNWKPSRYGCLGLGPYDFLVAKSCPADDDRAEATWQIRKITEPWGKPFSSFHSEHWDGRVYYELRHKVKAMCLTIDTFDLRLKECTRAKNQQWRFVPRGR